MRKRTQSQCQIVEATTAAAALSRAELTPNGFGASVPIGTDNWSYEIEQISAR